MRDSEQIYRDALDTFGAEAQTRMLFEEFSELQKELCKHARGKDNRMEIAEEIADVWIMIGQMTVLYDCEDDVIRIALEKLERLEGEIQKAKAAKECEKLKEHHEKSRPLNLYELRKAVDEGGGDQVGLHVWVKMVSSNIPVCAVLDYTINDGVVAIWAASYCHRKDRGYFAEKDYGKTWLAYWEKPEEG